jgi:hypothetical protein
MGNTRLCVVMIEWLVNFCTDISFCFDFSDLRVT